MDNEIDRSQRIGIIARLALRRPRVSTSGRAEAARNKPTGRPARAIPRGPDQSWRSCRKSLRSFGIRSAEPTPHEQPKMPSPSTRRASGAQATTAEFAGGSIGPHRGPAPLGGGAAADRSPRAGRQAKHTAAEAVPTAPIPAAAPKAGIAGTGSMQCRPASRGARRRPDSGPATNGAGRRSRASRGSGSPSPPIPGRARGPRRSPHCPTVPGGSRFGKPVRADATPGSSIMPASPGPIGRGSSGSTSGSGSPVPIPAGADRLIRLFECRGGRGPLPSRLAAAPWQRLAALDRSLEFPGGTKRCSTRYSESRFSARRQLRIVSNSPSSASSPRRIAGKKRFLNSVVPVRWTTLSRAGTTRTARSASPRARQAPSGGPAPGPGRRHGYPCPRRGPSRKVRVVPWRIRSIHPAGKTGFPPIRPRSREARPNRARSRRHREPGGALLHPGRCRERYPARRKEVAPAGSRSRGVRGRRHANRSSGRRATPTLSRAPGLPATEPMRPHRRVGAMRRDRALTRPTSCLSRIRPSASGACAVVGTAHRFSCFRADGRRIEPIPRGRPIDTDRGREAASCNRRHSDGRPRRRAGRDGGRVRLPGAARDPIRGARDRRGRTGPRRQLPYAR